MDSKELRLWWDSLPPEVQDHIEREELKRARSTEVATQQWVPSPPEPTDRDRAVAKGKYWLPDLFDTRPPIEVQKPRHRTSKWADEFDGDDQ